MHALRNILSSRTLSFLRQNGQNALLNFTQPVDGAAGGSIAGGAAASVNQADQQSGQPLLIPKSILDATTFKGKQLSARTGTVSPNTLQRYRHMQRKVELVYRCTLCNTRNSKLVSEAAYTNGVVILQCDGCAVNHLIRDNLGWFANTKGKSFDEVLAEQGQNVKVVKVNERGELI